MLARATSELDSACAHIRSTRRVEELLTKLPL
jgi:hypothetical protein